MGSHADRRVYLEMLQAYGGKCACCGIDYLPFLSIDHVNGDGALERRARKGGSDSNITIAYRAKRNSYPDIYQVLCTNCNRAKGTGPKCPCKGGTDTRTVDSEINLYVKRRPGGQPGQCAILNEEQVREIRRRWEAGGVMLKEMAEEYGVATSTIHSVTSRRAWKHVS